MIYSLGTPVKRKVWKNAVSSVPSWLVGDFFGPGLSFIVANGCWYVVKNFFTVGAFPAQHTLTIPRTEAYEQWVKP